MPRNMMWKILLILAVIIISAVALVPFKGREPIQLGLDLKGGTHLVMKVNTIDAVRAEVDQAMERFKAQVANLKLPTPTTRRTGDTTFLVVPPAGLPVNDYDR